LSMGFFIDITFLPHYGPEFDSASNRNIVWVVIAAVAYGWQTYHL